MWTMKTTYLNPVENGSECARVFQDGSTLSYNIDRRCWMLLKDGQQLALRDTLLPQPQEIFEILEDDDKRNAERSLYAFLQHCFKGTRESHKNMIEMILREAALGLSFGPDGPIYAFDYHHVKCLVTDYVGGKSIKGDALMHILTANTYKHPNLCVFLMVPDSDWHIPEEDDNEVV